MVGAKRFRCVEGLLQQGFTGTGAIRHVVLSGGTTVFQGTFERVTRYLTKLAPSTMKIQGATRVVEVAKMSSMSGFLIDL